MRSICKTICAVMITSAPMMANTGWAQTAPNPDALKAMNSFFERAEQIKVDIYADRVQDLIKNEPDPKVRDAKLNATMYYSAICSLQRQYFYNRDNKEQHLDDAVRLNEHYQLFARAMARHGLMSVEQAKQDFVTKRPKGEAFIAQIYNQQPANAEAEPKERAILNRNCDGAAVLTQKIDNAALNKAAAK